ncbi:MarR family winged helix-turn-helix transcriptional regulator [Acidihalobacter ferrooxydans]|uniref:HTH marR-type domain-containing protein n=1 Tax=Acidihalobacter ferrooxydans TaxID=1765967 RepID=A0A1P8UDV5_9GAMM|nr:MarR family transcriptional regulator [Acidihalobacter ferrooxydans]APZ41986.1 hypothetical protein BW247_01800 [Acidihalobacter ferrooxydans]
MSDNKDLSDNIMIALRRIMHAVESHSHQLTRTHGLTSPQLLILKQLMTADELSVGDIAVRTNISKATATEIIQRLERRGLVEKIRSQTDKRRVFVRPTAAAVKHCRSAPPLLQERFAQRLDALEDWERNLLLSSLQRVASLMDAADLDVAPVLSGAPLTDAPHTTPGSVTPLPTQTEKLKSA